jgi:cytochrome c peroxidase
MQNTHKPKPTLVLGLAAALCGTVALALQLNDNSPWTDMERKTIRSLSLASLPNLPTDPSNKYESNPQAVALGELLFNEKQLSSNGEVSCATCHNPEKFFTDGEQLAEGVKMGNRHTPTIIGAAYSPFQFWDGRADSLWMQALGPLENPLEHDIDRTQVVRVVQKVYNSQYTALFGNTANFGDPNLFPEHASPLGTPEARRAWESMPPSSKEAVNRAFSNVGKAIAAFVRTINPNPTRFDAYINALESGDTQGLEALNANQVAGLRLFIGKANCVGCHNGPMLSDGQFHNTAVPNLPDFAPDLGRFEGRKALVQDEFNCQSKYSDAAPDQCLALSKAALDIQEADAVPSEDTHGVSAYKTPTLRHIAQTAPYMRSGQFLSLKRVLEHYNNAPKAALGRSELKQLRLNDQELQQLEAFLRTLESP